MTVMEYHILPWQDSYGEAAARLEGECFGENITAEAFCRFSDAPANHYFCAVGEDGTLLGYGGISLVADEAEIITVAVAPLYRRRGIARCLMEHMLRLADQTRASVYLEVRESNIPARNLYAALGFSETGVRKNYYTSPRENAVLMMRVPGAEETLSC
jgi:ribosomal-protein-alanine N-acetyltransferase